MVDGVTLATGNRILIKNQSTGSENGIYTVASSGAPTRATDLPTGVDAAGIFTFIEEGTTLADTGWVCTSNSGSAVVDTDALAFAQFSSSTTLTGGTNITVASGAINLDNTIVLTSGSITDNSCTLSFSTTNLSTTGTLAAGVTTVNSSLILAAGSITDSTGAITFDNENLSTTGSVTGGSLITGTMTITGGTITDTTAAVTFGAAHVTARKFTSTSDRRAKHSISNLDQTDCLQKVLQLQGVHYKLNEDETDDAQLGLIAQDVEGIFPEFVETDPKTDMKSINYAQMVAVLVESVKAQQVLIDELRGQ